jgi:hypothetical protein
MLIGWQDLLSYSAVTLAVVGGILSVTAYFIRRKKGDSEPNTRKAYLLFLASYILMSVSVFLIAFRGLLM